MIIKSVSLTNFRNHETYHLDCNPDTTLILGKNGCGKTSVLEAIYILTRGKSFRATDPEIIKRDADFYRIEIEQDNGEIKVATYDGKTKTFQVSEKKSRRLPKNAKYPVILFQPSDLNLIGGSPSRHREYFDRIFSEFSDNYSSYISRYEKALHQRNELLKSENVTSSALFSWNILLAKYGSLIYSLRHDFIRDIENKINEVYLSIADTDDTVDLIYQSDLSSSSENEYLSELEQNFTKDSYLGHTSFGIHRDDIRFIFNGKDADGSASRGETRSIILALKFVEAALIYQKTNLKPIVLLDDVFSELDQTRRRCLVDNFKDHQVILTSVEDITRE